LSGRRGAAGAGLGYLVVLVIVCGLGGCAIVNPQSAAHLSTQALQTTGSLIQTLEETRSSLNTYVEGQTLSAPLLGQEPLPKPTLCSIQSAQRSLRLRVQLLSKLALVYERFADLANQGVEDTGVFDNAISELDRADYPVDPPLVEGCPGDAPAGGSATAAAPTNVAPGVLMGISKSRSLRYASARLRELLVKIIALIEQEQPVYASLQREALRSRKGLAKALLLKYGTVAPGDLLAPQLQDLGLRWDERQLQQQQQSWPPEKKAALQQAIAATVERRATQLIATQSVALQQHLAVLRALVRLHQSLEDGQPLDWRQVSAFALPTLQSIQLRSQCPVR
jgi:hypothetical protein